MRGIRLFIFDIGGVLSLNPPIVPAMAGHLGLSPDAFWAAQADLFDRLTVGSIGVMDAWREFSRRTGATVIEDLWARFFDPRLDAGVAALIGELRGRARVVAGTNTIEPHYRFHLQRGDYALFDAVYASCRMGLAKPDPAFWRAILESERCAPEEAAFVDDLSENVAGARAAGLRAVLHREAEATRRELEAAV